MVVKSGVFTFPFASLKSALVRALTSVHQCPRAIEKLCGHTTAFFPLRDVGRIVWSEDAAENWKICPTDGLQLCQTVSGLVIDGKYVHAMFGSLFTQALGNFDTKAGLHRMDRTTGKWTFRKALPKVYGSNDGAFRRNLRYVAVVAGSGSGPETRTIFALHAPATVWTGAGGLTTFQFYKSTNGGDTYAADGNTLDVATFGTPFEIWADATALYINTSKGVWRRPISGTAWKKATGLPSGACYHLEKHGSTVFVSVAGQGFYKAADAETLAFSLVKAGDVVYFAICPTNTNKRILILSGSAHLYTAGGDTGWTQGASTQYAGQFNDFSHRMWGNSSIWVKWHTTNENIVYAMRFSHPGKSENAGETFRWASKNNDYSEVRDIAVSPSQPGIMALGATDRLMIYCAAPYYTMDILQAKKDTLKAATEVALGQDLSAQSCSGVLILERGNYRRFMGQVGEHTKPKVLVRFEKTTATSRTDAGTTGNGAVTLSSSHNCPGGIYTFTCTAAAANGGTFKGRGPMGLDMGTWSVGTERTFNHPMGGTVTAKFDDGSVDWKVGATVQYTVNPIGDWSLMDFDAKTSAQVGQTNPAVPYRGCTGRYCIEMDTSGVVTKLRTLAYTFQGYMGTSGNVILASDGDTTLRRSDDEGVTWTTFASGLGSFNALGAPVVAASPSNDQRGYAGQINGKVIRIQNGVKATIFDFDAWCTERNISTSCPGTAAVNGRWCPPIMGIVESPKDPNLVHIALYTFGEPYALFRSKNAQAAAADVEWENITFDANGDGIGGPIQRMRQHKDTNEPILCSIVGTGIVDLPDGFRTANAITRSLLADLHTMPGYATFTSRM